MTKLSFSTICAAGVFAAALAAPADASANSRTGGISRGDIDIDIDFDFWGWWQNGGNPVQTPALRGTKCWSFQAAFGKPAFIQLEFKKIRNGQSLISGQVFRADVDGNGNGKKPDRVLQVSGSAGYHSFYGDNDVKIDRYLLDLHYSFSKTGTDAANAFAEVAFHTRGHYSVRLDAQSLDGVFAGNDFILKWAPPLTGPQGPVPTFGPDASASGGPGITANYMGGINCEGGSCGVILPLNNAGTWTLVGNNSYECQMAAPPKYSPAQ